MSMEAHRLPRRSCDRAGPNIEGRLFGLGLSIYDLFVSPDQSDSLNPSDPKPGNIRGKFLRLDPSKLPANPPKGRNATKSSKEARDPVGLGALKCWDRGVPVLADPLSHRMVAQARSKEHWKHLRYEDFEPLRLLWGQCLGGSLLCLARKL